ncbi:hypothetical protein IPG41_06765 [Candidatus Peregrinibacteria bacterium]|nr:MAG: hypothetical protein IPG41_06765 [Candidatus Peregrinibacteria bacterium]
MEDRAPDQVQAYLDAVLPHIPNSVVRKEIETNARAASAEGTLYGPFADRKGQANGVAAEMMRRATLAIQNGLPDVLNLDVSGAAEAMDVMLWNCVATDREYPYKRAVQDGKLNSTRRAILAEQFSASEFVDKSLEMSEDVALDQVLRANQGFNALRGRHPQGQRFVANANYAGWTHETMTTGTGMLEDSRSLEDMIRQEGTGMAHLRASNFVLGSGVKDFAGQFGHEGFTWIDLGSGTGATIAAGLKGIQDLEVRPNMQLVGIEGTQAFHGALLRDQKELFSLAGGHAELDGNSSFIFADMVDGVQSVVGNTPIDRPLVVTANFALHRLPTTAKAEILQILAERPTVALLVGDLHVNGSVANRRYFNFGFNGPSNCGHIGTGQLARQNDFVHLDASLRALPGLDPVLQSFVRNGPSNDAHVNFYGRGVAVDWAQDFLGERIL